MSPAAGPLRCKPELARLVGVVPPGLDYAAVVSRLDLRSRELVPVGDRVAGLVPVRHPVMLRPEHTVESTGSRLHLLARPRGDYLLDQRIDGLAPDAGQVEAALDVGGGGAPVVAQFRSRRVAQHVSLRGDV